MKKQQQVLMSTAFVLLLLSFFFFASFVLADPNGATISAATTVTASNITPGTRSDPRGTITTMTLNALQQDQHWKGYVGNVTGSYTLDNPNNFTLYSWDLTTISGQVYASRFGNLSWSSVSCAPANLVINESIFNNMTATQADRLNATFNWSIHKQFLVGSNTIASDTCNSTVTYINDTRQAPTTASAFQEVLIRDATYNYLIYMTDISYHQTGFDNTTSTFDFQMIVGESDVKASPTPYYFYVELR